MRKARGKRVDPFYKSGRWLAVRAAALARDGYLCQVSRRYGLRVQADTVHHVFPREVFPEYQYAMWNLISVCAAKHDELHDRGTGRLSEKGQRLLVRTARREGIPVPDWFLR